MLKLVVDHYPIAQDGRLFSRIRNAVADRPSNSVWQIPDAFSGKHCGVAGALRFEGVRYTAAPSYSRQVGPHVHDSLSPVITKSSEFVDVLPGETLEMRRGTTDELHDRQIPELYILITRASRPQVLPGMRYGIW